MKDALRAGTESYGYTVQSVAAWSIVHNFLNVPRHGLRLARKSINGFVASFTSSFDQLKIKFYTEIVKKKQNGTKQKKWKSHPWKLSITIEKEYIPLLNWNRPFPSSPGPLFQNEGSCSDFNMEIIFHSDANKTHFHVVQLASFWKWGFLDLGSGLLSA